VGGRRDAREWPLGYSIKQCVVWELVCLQLQSGSKPSVFSISVDSNGASQTAQDDDLDEE